MDPVGKKGSGGAVHGNEREKGITEGKSAASGSGRYAGGYQLRSGGRETVGFRPRN